MIFQPETPVIDKSSVLHHLGKRGAGRTGRALAKKIDACLNEITESAQPLVYLRRMKIEGTDKGGVDLNGAPRLKSPKLARTMRGCGTALCFLATAGPEVDRLVARLNRRGRVSQAFVADAIGSLLIEQVVEDFQEQTARRLRKRGQGVSLRFSPGYCDWPVTQQKSLFQCLAPEEIGVELSESCLMSPRKTISGVFGVYDLGRADLDQPYNPCMDCHRKSCSARRAPSRAA